MLSSAFVLSALVAFGAAQQDECEPSVSAPDTCTEEGTCVAGRGLRLFSGDESDRFLYKDDRGKVNFPNDPPSALDGRDFFTYDNYPIYDSDAPEYDDSYDSREDEVISQMQSDKEGELLIALSSPDAAGNGWERMNSGSGADFMLNTDAEGYEDELQYWLYTYSYNEPQTWVDLPTQDEDALPAFAFGEPDEVLSWANPLPLPEGSVIDEAGLITNPTFCVLPGQDGEGDVYLASASGVAGWKVWRSTDQGETWERWAKFATNLNRQTIFVHDGSVYIMGTLKRPEETDDPNAQGIIYRSTDGGKTFDDLTLLPFDGGDAPSNVQYADGRIWKAVPGPDSTGKKGSTLASAPVDSDLMDADSWTVAQVTEEAGNEGVTLLSRDGVPINVAKASDGAAIVWADGTDNVEFDKDEDSIPLPSRGKFSMQYDEASDKYWALTNGGGQPRNVITLYSSDDLKTWTTEREVLFGPSSRYHGFNYPSMMIEGDDIIFVSRTAWETTFGLSDRWHDGNMFTFHRVENFRSS